MSQGGNLLFMNRLSTAWNDRFEHALPEWIGEYWEENQKAQALPCQYFRDQGEVDSSLTIPKVFQRALSVVSATYNLTLESSVRTVYLTPLLIRKRIEVALDGLNNLVPYPRLTDKSKDLWAGLFRFILEANEPTNELAIMDIVNVMSIRLKVGVEGV
jgi:hypothetical protein